MGKGKAKIAIKKIESLQARNVCFTKRRKGLVKKAAELGHLFPEVRIAAVVFSPAGNPYVFGDLSEMEKLLAMEESRKEWKLLTIKAAKSLELRVQAQLFLETLYQLSIGLLLTATHRITRFLNIMYMSFSRRVPEEAKHRQFHAFFQATLPGWSLDVTYPACRALVECSTFMIPLLISSEWLYCLS
nr:agamous-like MADS-box protein AGL61 [Ipomoea batatas]